MRARRRAVLRDKEDPPHNIRALVVPGVDPGPVAQLRPWLADWANFCHNTQRAEGRKIFIDGRA